MSEIVKETGLKLQIAENILERLKSDGVLSFSKSKYQVNVDNLLIKMKNENNLKTEINDILNCACNVHFSGKR